MKRILFCTPTPLTKSLGAAKVVVELAEEMQELGWECDLISIKDLADQTGQSMSESLRHYLQEHADEYNVVDYDHEYLPYARSEFSQKTLFVARSVLLNQHLETIRIPQPSGIKAAVGEIIKGAKRQRKRRDMVCRAQTTVEEADLVNVSNADDKMELLRRGLAAENVVVIPYGISRARRPLFDQVSSVPPKQPVVAFVGTFDYRKGAREFPQIVDAILERVPQTCFRLLGTKGMFQTKQEIISHFPRKSAQAIEVIPSYAPEELPCFLAPCSIGIFPSHMEGFGFGVLEMLAASIPVIAYDAPGPPMMLSPASLVPRGNWHGMSEKVINLLNNEDELMKARLQAKRRSQDFNWDEIAKTTSEQYLTRIAQDRRV